MTDERRSKLGIEWSTVIAGALAAVTVAVLLSTLGAAGTLVGAAIGSVVASVAGAVYRQGIDTSARKVAELHKAALVEVGVAQEDVRRASRAHPSPTAEADLARAERRLGVAIAELESVDAAPVEPEPDEAVAPSDTRELEVVEVPRRGRWASLPWRRIAVVALGLFIVTVLVIGAFELLTGRSVSSYTGGGGDNTSFSELVDDDQDQGDDDRGRSPVEQPTDQSEDQTTDGPRDQPTDTATTPPTQQPSEQPTPSEQPSQPSGTEQPSQEPTDAPPTTPSPTDVVEPDPTATP
jgi:hypothetical protein